jgi:hypothetical protein
MGPGFILSKEYQMTLIPQLNAEYTNQGPLRVASWNVEHFGTSTTSAPANYIFCGDLNTMGLN